MAQLVQELGYKAYILRIWKESKQWRFSLEPIGSGRRQGFAHIDQIVEFLKEMTPVVEQKNTAECKTAVSC